MRKSKTFLSERLCGQNSHSDIYQATNVKVYASNGTTFLAKGYLERGVMTRNYLGRIRFSFPYSIANVPLAGNYYIQGESAQLLCGPPLPRAGVSTTYGPRAAVNLSSRWRVT